VLKTIGPDDLCSALRQAVDRRVYLFAVPNVPGGAMPAEDEAPKLTRREREVLTLVADGWSNVEVARQLWISVATVKFHLSRTYEKLDVSNRTGAVRWAHQNGLLGQGLRVVGGRRTPTPSAARAD
jgi:DNA-binding NarL/FixJ family response regulator